MVDYIITYNILFFRYDNSNNKENNGEKMKNKTNNICEHNNTITNECSDCNESELFDSILGFSLTKIMDLLTDTHNVVPEFIDDYEEENDYDIDDEMKVKVEEEIYKRLNKLNRR